MRVHYIQSYIMAYMQLCNNTRPKAKQMLTQGGGGGGGT